MHHIHIFCVKSIWSALYLWSIVCGFIEVSCHTPPKRQNILQHLTLSSGVLTFPFVMVVSARTTSMARNLYVTVVWRTLTKSRYSRHRPQSKGKWDGGDIDVWDCALPGFLFLEQCSFTKMIVSLKCHSTSSIQEFCPAQREVPIALKFFPTVFMSKFLSSSTWHINHSSFWPGHTEVKWCHLPKVLFATWGLVFFLGNTGNSEHSFWGRDVLLRLRPLRYC